MSLFIYFIVCPIIAHSHLLFPPTHLCFLYPLDGSFLIFLGGDVQFGGAELKTDREIKRESDKGDGEIMALCFSPIREEDGDTLSLD